METISTHPPDTLNDTDTRRPWATVCPQPGPTAVFRAKCPGTTERATQGLVSMPTLQRCTIPTAVSVPSALWHYSVRHPRCCHSEVTAPSAPALQRAPPRLCHPSVRSANSTLREFGTDGNSTSHTLLSAPTLCAWRHRHQHCRHRSKASWQAEPRSSFRVDS